MTDFTLIDPTNLIQLDEFENEAVLFQNLEIIISSLYMHFGEKFTSDPVSLIQDLHFGTGDDIFKQVYEFFAFQVIGICGCGCSGHIVQTLADHLDIINQSTKAIAECKDLKNFSYEKYNKMREERFGTPYITGNVFYCFMAEILDDRGLTDHGNNIDGAYITTLGEVCLWIFKICLKKGVI